MNTISNYNPYNCQFNIKKSTPSFKMKIKCTPEAFGIYAKKINTSKGSEYLKEILKYTQSILKDVKGTMWVIDEKGSDGFFIGYEMPKTDKVEKNTRRYYINPFITNEEPEEKVYVSSLSKHIKGSDNGSIGEVSRILKTLEFIMRKSPNVPNKHYLDASLKFLEEQNKMPYMLSKKKFTPEFENLLVNTRDMFSDKKNIPTLEQKINHASAVLYSRKHVSNKERKAAWTELMKICQSTQQACLNDEEQNIVKKLLKTYNMTDTTQLSQMFNLQYKTCEQNQPSTKWEFIKKIPNKLKEKYLT